MKVTSEVFVFLFEFFSQWLFDSIFLFGFTNSILLGIKYIQTGFQSEFLNWES